MTSTLHGVLRKVHFACVNCYIFVHFSLTPLTSILNLTIIRLYRQKANKTTFPKISCPYGNIVNISHTSRIYFLANNTSLCPFKQVGAQIPKNPRNSPFPLRHVDPIHQCLGLRRLPPQTASGSSQPFCHNALTGQTDRQTDRQMG